MFCTHCGKEILQNVRYCTHCGRPATSVDALPVTVNTEGHGSEDTLDLVIQSSAFATDYPHKTDLTSLGTKQEHAPLHTPQDSIYIGKSRNAGLVILFSIITFGIYHVVWYYKINKEIALHDQEQQFSPGLAAFALFVPIASWVTLYNTANRIKLMQIQDNSRDSISPGIALVFVFLFGLGYYIVIQGALNNHWHAHRRPMINTIQ